MNRRDRFFQSELVRIARQNPEYTQEEVVEAATDSLRDADIDEEVMRELSDEPKDHAYNDCLDRSNPACAFAY